MPLSSQTSIRVFASHDWGKESENHKKVGKVVDLLRKRGIAVWFDETHMKGNIVDAMCKGIDGADVILVFLTKNYISKVESGEEGDNVRREFMYASNHSSKMLPIRFEETLPSKWTGPVGMILGSVLYTEMGTVTEKSISSLVGAIQNKTHVTLWKNAANRALRAKRVSSQVERRKDAEEGNLKARVEEGNLKGRVEKALLLGVGRGVREGEHTGDALNRLIDSILGGKGEEAKQLPFHKRLSLVEKELGM